MPLDFDDHAEIRGDSVVFVSKTICSFCPFFTKGQNHCKYCDDLAKKLTHDPRACLFYSFFGMQEKKEGIAS